MFTAMMSGRPCLALKHLIALRTIPADAVRTSSGVFAALTLRAARNYVRYSATLRSYSGFVVNRRHDL
ncbi:MAG: hypothetical protein CL547_02455 [Alcanivorax sp.]|nr:hypothetical protein [Alcanivorax sp.]